MWNAMLCYGSIKNLLIRYLYDTMTQWWMDKLKCEISKAAMYSLFCPSMVKFHTQVEVGPRQETMVHFKTAKIIYIAYFSPSDWTGIDTAHKQRDGAPCHFLQVHSAQTRTQTRTRNARAHWHRYFTVTCKGARFPGHQAHLSNI